MLFTSRPANNILRNMKLKFIAIAFLLHAGLSFGQKSLTLEEAVLGQYTTFYPETYRGVAWMTNEDAFTRIKKENKKESLVKVNAASGAETTLLTLDQLKTSHHDLTSLNSIPSITWKTANTFTFSYSNAYYEYDLGTNKAVNWATLDPSAENADVHDKTGNVAYTVDNNLYIKLADGKLIKVTNEYKGIVCGQSVHRNEFGINKGTFWSPDGNKLGFYWMDESMVNDYPLIDINQTPAVVKNIKYPMAGGTSHQVYLKVYDLASGNVAVCKPIQGFDGYRTAISWSNDSKTIYVGELNRDQNHLIFVGCNAETGIPGENIFEERSTKYVEPEQPAHMIPGGKDFLWFSERDGFNHIYRYTPSGKLMGQITKGNFDVEEILSITADGKLAFALARDESGLNTRLLKLDLNKNTFTEIATPKGMHNFSVSASGNYVLDNYSNLSTPRIIQTIDTKTGATKELLRAEDPFRGYTLGKAELHTVKASDGTTLNGRMIKPSFFDSTQSYPVLIYVYGGPHAQMITNSYLGGASLWMYHLAEAGYIVWTLDNRGSAHRGLKFEQATFRQLGTVEAEDQIAGYEYLSSKSYVQAGRIAVHGWSFGGFMTITLMSKYPEQFRVGVAGGPVIDWSLYEVMYTERYMDTPIDNKEGYVNSNLLNFAEQRNNKLLIIHGSIDDVVVPQHSLNYLKKCVSSNKQVDFFTYPMHPHNVRGKDRVHLMQKVLDYIQQNNY